MQIRREEIRTGLLVVISVGIITAVLLALGAPGVFKPVRTYRVFFDNAGGIKQGAPVLLAGRKVGQVTRLFSPVPPQDRPPAPKDGAKEGPPYEALIEMRVDSDALVYRNVKVRMLQYSLLGEQVVDFSSGDESQGIAPTGAYFVGERDKGFADAISEAVRVVKDVVVPVAEEAEKTMAQLRDTAGNLKEMTAPGSNIDQAVVRFRQFGDNLVEISGTNSALRLSLNNIQALTGPDGHLSQALANVDRITNDLVRQDKINKTLDNFQRASRELTVTIDNLGPQFNAIGKNLEQASDTVKKQPWRLIWPSTKKYPADTQLQPVQLAPVSTSPRSQPRRH